MSPARVVGTSVVAESRSRTRVASDYSVARSWVYELPKLETKGEADLKPLSRRGFHDPCSKQMSSPFLHPLQSKPTQ
jgi:hypothetical protein